MSKVEQFCQAVGGDYQDLVGRLVSERLIADFVVKFLSDDTFETLKKAFETADAESAFRSAHTLKGIALNLGFGNLGRSSSRLTEALRDRTFHGAEKLFADVVTDYEALVAAIRQILM